MKLAVVLLSICLTPSLCLAQSSTSSSGQTLQERSAQAQALYDKHAYVEAAAILEKLSQDRRVTALPNWPDQLYNLACDQALAGKPAQALLTLQQAVDLGTSVSVDHIREDSDLASLHADPHFQQLVSRMLREAAFWKDDAAIATSYKPVLTEDEKVAGLSKFWSEARFNFPFFGRQPNLGWDRLYMDYLPQVRTAQTTADYYRVLIRFAASLHDGHTNVFFPKELYASFYALPGLRTQLIENKVIVTQVSDPALTKQGIALGMELVKVDGQDVREYAEQQVDPYVSSSTIQDRNLRDYNYQLLNGSASEPVHLLLEDAGGSKVTVSATRQPFDYKAFIGEPVQFKVLPGNIAYLAVNEFDDDLGPKAMQQHFAEIAQSSGLVIDVRKNGGGNVANGFAILSMLADKQTFETPSWQTVEYKAFYRALGVSPGWTKGGAEAILPDHAHAFLKPVAVLISAQTFSAAEDFVAAFDAMHRGILVGDATAGSTGQPLPFSLPGGGTARICTTDHSYPNGRTFEGIGIPPEIKLSPSISDIRNGRDAALEKAISILVPKDTLHNSSSHP